MAPPVGHAQAGHDPDRPYLDKPKALQAAKAIYDLIPSRCCGGCEGMAWDKVAELLDAAFIDVRNVRKDADNLARRVDRMRTAMWEVDDAMTAEELRSSRVLR